MIDYNIIALLYRYNTNYRMFFVKKILHNFLPFHRNLVIAPPASIGMDLLALVTSSLLKSIQPLSVALAVQYMVVLVLGLRSSSILAISTEA